MPLAVDTAQQTRARETLAVESGIPSRKLMQTAGEAAAAVIVRRFHSSIGRGVEIHAGPGNNGGDGWVVAGELAKRGIGVNVVQAAAPKTKEAIDAMSCAAGLSIGEQFENPGIVIDALLGTGSTGEPKGTIAGSVAALRARKEMGAIVVALDLPTGLDATSGKIFGALPADLTLAFGTLKRGHLISRELCGALEVLDIGLGEFGAAGEGDCALIDGDWVSRWLPRIPLTAHKGTRKRIAIIAGDVGMAGAAILAGRGALRSGIGVLHLIVARANRDAVHAAVPAALVSTHDELIQNAKGVLRDADAIVIGPGLLPAGARRLLDSLECTSVPLLLDAGALSAFDEKPEMLAAFRAREVVITPHPAEMGRLLGVPTDDILDQRFDVALAMAREAGITVLLKGTPTVVTAANGRRRVSASGTPALATGGSGDMLSGIIGTLLAQTGNAFESAACAAWVHGRAAELCGRSRGITLEDILFAMPAAWRADMPVLQLPSLARLLAVQ